VQYCLKTSPAFYQRLPLYSTHPLTLQNSFSHSAELILSLCILFKTLLLQDNPIDLTRQGVFPEDDPIDATMQGFFSKDDPISSMYVSYCCSAVAVLSENEPCIWKTTPWMRQCRAFFRKTTPFLRCTCGTVAVLSENEPFDKEMCRVTL